MRFPGQLSFNISLTGLDIYQLNHTLWDKASTAENRRLVSSSSQIKPIYHLYQSLHLLASCLLQILNKGLDYFKYLSLGSPSATENAMTGKWSHVKCRNGLMEMSERHLSSLINMWLNRKAESSTVVAFIWCARATLFCKGHYRLQSTSPNAILHPLTIEFL